MCVWTATLDADTRLQAALRGCAQRTTTRRAACSVQHATHGTRRAPPDSQHGCPPQTRKSRFFYAPSASAANALQSNLSGMRPMHACARCVLRPQPTYRACVHGRERAQPAGTHLGLRPNQRFGLQTPRPTDDGVDAKPNSQCVASYVPVSAMCCADPLTVSRNVLCSRPTRCRPTTAADRAQCDAHIMPRVCRRMPKNAVCAVLRACRGVASRRAG